MRLSWNSSTASLVPEAEQDRVERQQRAHLAWHESHLNALALSRLELSRRWFWLRRYHVGVMALWIAGLQLLWVVLVGWGR